MPREPWFEALNVDCFAATAMKLAVVLKRIEEARAGPSNSTNVLVDAPPEPGESQSGRVQSDSADTRPLDAEAWRILEMLGRSEPRLVLLADLAAQPKRGRHMVGRRVRELIEAGFAERP
ncbi:MAG: hypothetical protein IPJ41_09350, partial [Phycisphaerales bacterium]|nr:hypothetical protein [Phycisphaerales bacterium]